MDSNMQKLVTWWRTHSKETCDGFTDKLAQYGSGDLYGIGRAMADIYGDDIDDDTAFELGVLFYIVGKIERAKSAVKNGQAASDDTWHDIHVYAKMVLAHREGVWPS